MSMSMLKIIRRYMYLQIPSETAVSMEKLDVTIGKDMVVPRPVRHVPRTGIELATACLLVRFFTGLAAWANRPSSGSFLYITANSMCDTLKSCEVSLERRYLYLL